MRQVDFSLHDHSPQLPNTPRLSAHLIKNSNLEVGHADCWQSRSDTSDFGEHSPEHQSSRSKSSTQNIT